MKINAAERRARDELIESIPWVKRVPEDEPCQGIKWGQVALKHLYSVGGRPAEGIPDRARCKLPAKWEFTALTEDEVDDECGHLAASGKYCIHHLFSQINDYEQELDRYRRWSGEKQQ